MPPVNLSRQRNIFDQILTNGALNIWVLITVAPLAWVPWNPSTFMQWVPAPINFGRKTWKPPTLTYLIIVQDVINVQAGKFPGINKRAGCNKAMQVGIFQESIVKKTCRLEKFQKLKVTFLKFGTEDIHQNHEK